MVKVLQKLHYFLNALILFLDIVLNNLTKSIGICF